MKYEVKRMKDEVGNFTSYFILLTSYLLLLSGCQPNSYVLEPNIFYVPQERHIGSLSPSFETFSKEESEQDWAKELKIGNAFGRELDLYRALTSFKRAQFLIPQEATSRQLQLEYDIMLSYYLGGKYQDAIEVFETSKLTEVTTAFPAFSSLLLIIYDSYQKTHQEEKAHAILCLIERYSPETAKDLLITKSVLEGDLYCTTSLVEDHPAQCSFDAFMTCYCCQKKSVRQAQFLNAILPGAGYLYVGQRNSALTSLILNVLFTTAAYQFFDHGFIAAGIITASLEFGWYFGGINGAGLAAKAYNEQLYNEQGKEFLITNGLFPILMFEKAF